MTFEEYISLNKEDKIIAGFRSLDNVARASNFNLPINSSAKTQTTSLEKAIESHEEAMRIIIDATIDVEEESA